LGGCRQLEGVSHANLQALQALLLVVVVLVVVMVAVVVLAVCVQLLRQLVVAVRLSQRYLYLLTIFIR
jgi:hypothetical protein